MSWLFDTDSPNTTNSISRHRVVLLAIGNRESKLAAKGGDPVNICEHNPAGTVLSPGEGVLI